MERWVGEYYIESNRCIEDIVRERWGGDFPPPTKQENLVTFTWSKKNILKEIYVKPLITAL